MVKEFLNVQNRQGAGKRMELAAFVAASHNSGSTVARNIIAWEKAWIERREIPRRMAPSSYASWLHDENIVMEIHSFARERGDSKFPSSKA